METETDWKRKSMHKMHYIGYLQSSYMEAHS